MPGLYDSKRWDVLPSHGESERLLCESLGISTLVARVLCARGITDPANAKRFLEPSLERDWEDPRSIPGMEQAVDRVECALKQGETIAVFGDFDVDGMTSTCLLTLALRALGATAHPYIPHRFGEGYGLSRMALDRVIADSHPNLIITVDNGIAAAREVSWLLEQGIDVVITDHHEPGDLVPQGVPVTDPKLIEDCPSRELAGAGVALKLVCMLGERLGQPDLWWSFVDLAAMGTVSDMMLLQGENRSLVAEGIARIRESNRPGIVALAATAGCDLTQITSDNLPFTLIPRLNAAGRLDSAYRGLELFTEKDPDKALITAQQLKDLNDSRKSMTMEGTDAAEAMIVREHMEDRRVLVLLLRDCHESLAGIIAGRIKERRHRPTFVLTDTGKGILKGSGRSIERYDMYAQMNACEDLFIKYGGHKMAGGLSMKEENFAEFERRVEEQCGLTEEDLQEVIVADMELPPRFLDLAATRELALLEPCGTANPKPLFVTRNIRLLSARVMGKNRNVIRFGALDEKGVRLDLIRFEDAQEFERALDEKAGIGTFAGLQRGTGSVTISMIYYPDVNVWNGRESMQYVMNDFRVSGNQ